MSTHAAFVGGIVVATTTLLLLSYAYNRGFQDGAATAAPSEMHTTIRRLVPLDPTPTPTWHERRTAPIAS